MFYVDFMVLALLSQVLMRLTKFEHCRTRPKCGVNRTILLLVAGIPRNRETPLSLNFNEFDTLNAYLHHQGLPVGD